MFPVRKHNLKLNTMNKFTLKALLLSVITEIKFNQPLHKSAQISKREFKQLVGLPANADNKTVLKALELVYFENNKIEDFNNTLKSFKISI